MGRGDIFSYSKNRTKYYSYLSVKFCKQFLFLLIKFRKVKYLPLVNIFNTVRTVIACTILGR